MKEEPCNVCGSTDLNLIDGYYYCVECGTQDVNVRETVVEQTYMADGTIALVTGKKFATIVKDGIEMSGEWYKWHAYNFILAGLTEELIKLGAKPTVKLKVLWIWTRYIKKFQVKEDMEVKSKIGESHLSISKIPNTPSDSGTNESDEEVNVKKKSQSGKFTKDIKIFTKGLLLAMLYLALNFDRSHIQLSHLFRFIREGRLSFLSCTKYLPKEINTKLIPHWKSFLLCQSDYNSHTIRAYAMTCIKYLDLGLPVTPDFNKIVDSYIQELCLPNNFKDLVLSLMLYHPCKNIDMNKISLHMTVRLPDYESVAMSYVLVALKMCFGLDGDYEMQISEVVDEINNKENYVKSHKLGMCSEPSDRLFSFCEWTRFLQFRKTILCQHYLPMARQHNLEADEYVLMEQMEERSVRPIRLRDEVTMDILNKIPSQRELNLIPKNLFVSSLTPMSTYTDVIINYILNNEIRLLLSEDFTQYCLKYATVSLILEDAKNNENSIVGISEANKLITPVIKGSFDPKEGDMSMVFIRNCENKNWLKTNPPTAAHITKIEEDETGDGDSDTNVENTQVNNDDGENEEVKLEFFQEESENTNIFDDDFENIIHEDKSSIETINSKTEFNEFDNENFNRDTPECNSTELNDFDINNIDKTKLIDELVAIACAKYKIPMPKPYPPREVGRRRSKRVVAEAGESAPKKRRGRTTAPNETQMKIDDMIAAYYTHVEDDLFTKLTEQVTNAINSTQRMDTDVGTANDIRPEESNMTSEQNDRDQSLINHSLCSNNNTARGTDSLNVSDADEEENEGFDLNVKSEDPNFDAKTHNIEQLYVKVNEARAFDDFININEDPELDQIINDNIGKICDDVTATNKQTVEEVTKCENYYSDSDEAERDIEEQRRLYCEREKMKECFEPLIETPLKTEEFKYWLRHYSKIKKNLDMHQKFESELNVKYPASFNFVIRECAAILHSSTFSLYKCMQKLETEIVKKSTKLCELDDF